MVRGIRLLDKRMRKGSQIRYNSLDLIRGITLISMFAYHAVWDLVYMFGTDISWYHSSIGYIWQQSICWTFIFLSGFCWSLGKRWVKRGLIVFGAGLLITAVTMAIMPEQIVVFGVLTLIGTSMLITGVLNNGLEKISATLGFFASLLVFFFTRNINSGYLGFEKWSFVKLPEWLYRNTFTSFLGFQDRNFHSTDYFSILPWYFMFLAGYFLCRLFKEKNWLAKLEKGSLPIVNLLGKHSLIIFLVHQPVIYLVLSLVY